MKRYLITGLSLGVLALTGFWLTACGGGAANTSNSPSSGAGAPMLVTVGDAPLSNLLSAQVTIASLSLVNSGGSFALLSKPRTVELSGLGATREPLELENVPLGNYTSLTLTVSAAQATYVNGSGQTVTSTATLNSPTVTVALNPALSVTTTDGLELQLDFNLAQSFDLTNNVLTFTPAINTAAAQVSSEDSGDKEVEVTGSVVSVSVTNNAGSITVKSGDSGAQFTFTINAATQFEGALSPAAIQPNALVEIQGAVQSDGSLLATEISAEMEGEGENASQQAALGTVTAVTTDSTGAVTSFTLVPREDFGGSDQSSTLTVSLSSSTVYNVGAFAALEGITAAQFTNAQIFAGQSVMVVGTVSGTATIAAQEVDLAPLSASGQLAAAPQGSSPDLTFTLQLASSSGLAVYQQLTALNVAANANTLYGDTLSASTFASTATGTSLDVNGFLLKDASGNFTLYAAMISQQETPETPEGGD